MLHLGNGLFIAETLEDLPNFKGAVELFGDVETQRVFDHDKLGGLYPWKGDRVCGIGLSFDEHPQVFYLPVRHTSIGAKNLPVEPVMRYLRDVLKSVKEWINHNIKFDAMMLAVGDDVKFDCRLIDTLTLSKLHYSDRMGYGLKDLTDDWLGYDTSAKDEVKAYLDSTGSKSFSDVPIDILGKYCCHDVRQNRMLYRYLQGKRPAEMANLWETEILLTPVLFDMEYDGMLVDIQQCKIEKYKCLKAMIEAADEIARLTGVEFTNSNDVIYDLLINQLGLPVLATIIEKDEDGHKYDTGRPTFDADAMELYKTHPYVAVDPDKQAIVNAIFKYRNASQFNSLFLDTFLELNVDGIVHPSYNQCVRTGRMSCSRPNSQQQNKRSKKLILPRPGYGFISNDYSQIEYRLIVHYVNDLEAIAAYCNNPLTDFHKWVAELLHITRKDAKTLNFGMAYGAGRKTVTHNLTANPAIIAEMQEKVKDIVAPMERNARFLALCSEHANRCYDAYHERFPGIRQTSYRACRVTKERGYIFNAYGRRRHLPERAAHKAFNSLIQGCAADISKERMVEMSPRYNKQSRDFGIRMAATVHDEILSETPLQALYDDGIHTYICNMLEQPKVQFRVPIKVGLGVSPLNWSEAAGDDIRRDEAGQFLGGKLR